MSRLYDSEIQDWLDAHEEKQLTAVLLRGSPFPNIDIRELAVQLEGRQKAKRKLPEWYAVKRAIIWPRRISLEQCSSEATARYKASLMAGKTFADLTGGMGVDAYYVAKGFGEGHYVEMQPELKELTAHNLKALGAHITCHQGEGIAWLKQQGTIFDWLYLDPARRGEQQQKVIRLQDYSPDITEAIPLLRSKADQVLVKVSPMADITELQRQLGQQASYHIVAVDNECKEILIHLHEGAKDTIHTINISGSHTQKESFCHTDGHSTITMGGPEAYVYEPNAAIMKAGAFSAMATRYGLRKLQANSHLYSSETHHREFPGRVFELIEIVKPTRKELKKHLPDMRGNLSVRNFPMGADALRKKLGLKDGGDSYLFATTLSDGQKVLLITKKATD